jgi:2-polyprenyl-3-methyl-5-hydroxy-6-metoxy-1,4-benzoquinol methylase
VRCRDCGLDFRNPREDDDVILGLYDEVEDAVYAENEAARRLTFARALDRLERHVPVRGALLDVACYTGVFLDVAAARGWRVAGVEPSRWAAAEAARKGHRVHHGTLRTAPWEGERFDVVTMWDALEHFTDPVGELRRARAATRDGGHLALSTMRVDCALVRLLGRRWPWYMRMHLCYFTGATLAQALRTAGWRLVHVHGYAHVVTWDYLLHKVAAWAPAASRVLRRAVRSAGLSSRTIPIDLGDFMTAYAVTA